jgi:ferredoxin
MQSQYSNLRELGFKDAHIFAEAFGPASLIRDGSPVKESPIANEAIITFTQSGLELAWSKADGSLLEFAEAHGLTPEYGCRSGQCGACKVRLLNGSVSYFQEKSSSLSKDEILLCCAVPAADTNNKITRLDIQL